MSCIKCGVKLSKKNYASSCGFAEHCSNCEKAILKKEFGVHVNSIFRIKPIFRIS